VLFVLYLLWMGLRLRERGWKASRHQNDPDQQIPTLTVFHDNLVCIILIRDRIRLMKRVVPPDALQRASLAQHAVFLQRTIAYASRSAKPRSVAKRQWHLVKADKKMPHHRERAFNVPDPAAETGDFGTDGKIKRRRYALRLCRNRKIRSAETL
jgi:hypothetical protein